MPPVNPLLPLACTVGAVGLAVYPPELRWLPRRSDRARIGAAGLSPGVRRAWVLGLGLAAAGVLAGIPWWAGAACAVALAVASLRIPVAVPAGRRRAERDNLIVHADLLAACLDAGLAVSAALAAVSGVLDRVARAPGARGDGRRHGGAPRLGGGNDRRGAKAVPSHRGGEATAAARLRSVAALFELGADPAVAWEPADGHPDLRDLAAAARRSAVAGTPLSDAARQHAALLRSARASEVQRRAGRAGVAMTAPLGLCFLPAFLCLGLAPVVVGLLGTLGIF